jgi:hypothetical protein
MFIKSAYLEPAVTKLDAQGWRFVSLAWQVAGVFPEKGKIGKPQKKGPVGLLLVLVIHDFGAFLRKLHSRVRLPRLSDQSRYFNFCKRQ